MYKKLTVKYEGDEKNLNRELIVDEDIGLVDLRLILTATLGACFCHLTEIVDKDSIYSEGSAYDEDQKNQKLMTDYSLRDLSDTFMFSYDFGECWDFQIKVTDTTKPKDMNGKAKIVSGFGAGLWEDNRYGYYQACMLTPAQRKTIKFNDESDFYPPWNLQYENIDNLFQTIDIKANQLRTNFMLEIFEDTYINEIQYGKYFTDRYKIDEIWKFTENGLSTDDKISFLREYSKKIDKEDYENLSSLISENNAFYLEQFYEWILKNGLTKQAAKKHCDNVSLYISDFLCTQFIQPCKYGILPANLEGFYNEFLIRRKKSNKPDYASAISDSLKNFYTFMGENGYINKSILSEYLETVKDTDSADA